MLDFLLKAAFLFQASAAAPAMDFTSDLESSPVPVIEEFVPPELDVTAAAVMDLASGQILYQQNIDMPLPMASLTKIMTAVITIENTPDLDAWMMIPDEALDTPGSKIWFFQYEKLRIYDVLAAALIKSGNDAARALAIQIGESEENFVEMMNDKARLLGLNDTHFTNPAGFDDQFHFSTARDLLRLAEYALRLPVFREIVGTSSLGIWSYDGFKRELYTTNKLMTDREPGDVYGVKTGTTEDAGQCLLILRRDPRGHEILAVVLSANDRWHQTRELTDWIWSVTDWH